MSALNDLLAHPFDEALHRYRSLPWPWLFGVPLPTTTSCGTVSRAASQCADAVKRARNTARQQLEHLTDADVLWLLVMGWRP